MTLYGLTTFLKRAAGIFIIITSISSHLGAEDLKESYLILGNEFGKSGQYFLSYQNYVSAFLLEKDTEKSIETGLLALSPCLTLNRVAEGNWLIQRLYKIDRDKDYYNTLSALLYLKGDMSIEASKKLDEIEAGESDNVLFLKSYSYFMGEKYDDCITALDKISEDFIYKDEMLDLSYKLNNPPDIKYKSPLLSGFISMIIPGGGQFYSGLTFDGINALLTNTLFGSTAAVLWLYEMDKEADSRNFSLPVISTAVFAVFYITNIYNAYNSANRFNNYHKNRYYNEIFEKFQLIIGDNSLFIGYKEAF